ncbi:hypothetical protein CC80DRAFT_545620 [Byssothecium circinans]|uniref:Heterokaryon incompatibility domain-containing protein n=1 Tax=Byssothecium circinans TaxID=147558 RepID=A0A6A5U8R3_9PLEO|nr:hypothetical protein CC80DRAFT_545620 [Byssothecium circinans]
MAMNARFGGRFQGEDGTLQRLLPRMRYCDATDPRDKVFSLLGIALDAEPLPKLDYHMSKEQVYTKIAIWWIEFYGTLELLSHADEPEAREGPTNAKPMASWIPDWSRRPSREILGVFEKTYFRAGGPKAVTSFPSTPTPSSNPILKARGMFIGTANKIISHCNRYADLIPIFREHGGYGSEEANEQALSNTLCLGYSRESAPFTKDKWHVLKQYTLWKTTHCDQAWELKEDRHGKRILDEEYLPCYDNRPIDIKYEGLFRTRRIGRVLAITENGFFCFAPDHLRKQDVIYIPYGSSMPVALRKVSDHYVVLGQCYVAGVMYGEVLPEERLNGQPRGVWGDSGEEPFPFRCELPKFENREEDIEIW